MIGTYVLSAGFYDAYFTKAQKVRTLIKRTSPRPSAVRLHPDPNRAFGGFCGRQEENVDPLAMYLNDVFAVPGEPGGLPAMSVPGGLTGPGCRSGLHLIGRELDEQGVLNAALAIEERAGFIARAGEMVVSEYRIKARPVSGRS
jgi:aspartyl-tRNA(Asn)/glutamyl-tRNA(Gln) amidotransferase subunit A